MTELYSSIKDQHVLVKYGLQHGIKAECGHSLAVSNISHQTFSLFSSLKHMHVHWETHDSVHDTGLHAFQFRKYIQKMEWEK